MAGYFGVLRVGEMTTGAHPIAASDVLVSDHNRKQFLLTSSKTHNKGNLLQSITIVSSSRSDSERLLNKHCPYQMILNYANSRPKYRRNADPFFVFRDGTPVKPIHYTKRLKWALCDIGLKARYYSCHSLKI